MGIYEEWILPALIDLSMRNKRLRPYRQRVAGAAEGRVLETLAFSQEPDHARTSFQERERYAIAWVAVSTV